MFSYCGTNCFPSSGRGFQGMMRCAPSIGEKALILSLCEDANITILVCEDPEFRKRDNPQKLSVFMVTLSS